MLPLQEDSREEGICPICQECLKEASHCELAIENAISHYKERLNRRIRKLRKDICELQQLRAQEEERLQAMQTDCRTHRLEAELERQHRAGRQLDALPQQRPGQLEDMPAEVSRITGISRAMIQLSSLVTELEGMAKKLDASLLKDASDLLNRRPSQGQVLGSSLWTLCLGEGSCTLLGAQGELGPSSPEPKEGKDLLGEGGSEGVDGFLSDGIGKGHPAHLVVDRHPHLLGLLLQGQAGGEGTQGRDEAPS
eukprot:bmy_18647T0